METASAKKTKALERWEALCYGREPSEFKDGLWRVLKSDGSATKPAFECLELTSIPGIYRAYWPKKPSAKRDFETPEKRFGFADCEGRWLSEPMKYSSATFVPVPNGFVCRSENKGFFRGRSVRSEFVVPSFSFDESGNPKAYLDTSFSKEGTLDANMVFHDSKSGRSHVLISVEKDWGGEELVLSVDFDEIHPVRLKPASDWRLKAERSPSSWGEGLREYYAVVQRNKSGIYDASKAKVLFMDCQDIQEALSRLSEHVSKRI